MKSTFFLCFTMLVLISNKLEAQILINHELSLEAAKKIMAQAMTYAESVNAPGGAIAIVDNGGHLILLERISGTFPVASEVAYGKARTAAIFKLPSKNLEDAIVNGRTSLITVGEIMLKGGLPIVYEGKVIGGIGVSGAASADQDLEIAAAGLEAEFE